jgi:hypothetical protein
LLEVGTAAGLCLYPDRYTYRYGEHTVGSSGPVLECTATGTVPPGHLPEVVWRAGLDLNPLDVTVARRADAGLGLIEVGAPVLEMTEGRHRKRLIHLLIQIIE